VSSSNIKYFYLYNEEHAGGAVGLGTAQHNRKFAGWNGCT